MTEFICACGSGVFVTQTKPDGSQTNGSLGLMRRHRPGIPRCCFGSPAGGQPGGVPCSREACSPSVATAPAPTQVSAVRRAMRVERTAPSAEGGARAGPPLQVSVAAGRGAHLRGLGVIALRAVLDSFLRLFLFPLYLCTRGQGDSQQCSR